MKSSAENLHIVSFDVPFPANYGGVIDIYYKLRSLRELGYNIILHCFEYGREKAPELNGLCKKVYYYKRRLYKNPFLGSLPYIVSSRNASSLLENLKKDAGPILFEGLHTTFFLNHPELENRFKIVRMHNIEHDYYASLEKAERHYFKKYFFRIESERLKKYQSILKHADLICAISPNDYKYLSKKFPNAMHLPPFHGNEKVTAQVGKGEYILYHGNLSVAENHEAALYLVNNVFSKISYPCIIAGNNPPKELVHAVEAFPNIRLLTNTSADHIHNLILGAHINVMHTSQSTGIKLKLINALYMGRHCIGNKEMLKNTGMEELCTLAHDSEEYIRLIHHFWTKEFTISDRMQREEVLLNHFNDRTNATDLSAAMQGVLKSETFYQTSDKQVKKNVSSIIGSMISFFMM